MIGDDPVRGLVSADNSLLYVGNLHSQDVTVYSIDDGKRIGSIHVGDGPSALAFSTAGHLLFVVDARSGDVAVVRTAIALALHHAPRRPRPQRHRCQSVQTSVGPHQSCGCPILAAHFASKGGKTSDPTAITPNSERARVSQ